MSKLTQNTYKKEDGIKLNVLHFINNYLLLKKRYIKDKSNNEHNEYNKQKLLDDLEKARQDLEIANINFEFAQNKEMIDYYIYKIKSAEIRYQYLLKQVKSQNIILEDVPKNNLHNKNHTETFYNS